MDETNRVKLEEERSILRKALKQIAELPHGPEPADFINQLYDAREIARAALETTRESTP